MFILPSNLRRPHALRLALASALTPILASLAILWVLAIGALAGLRPQATASPQHPSARPVGRGGCGP